MRTIQEAKNETIFYVENGNVVESNYYDFLTEFGGQEESPSAVEEEEVTTYNVGGHEFDSEQEAAEYCEENEIEENEIKEVTVTHYKHVIRYHANYGRKIRSSENFFADQDSAEAAFIQGLEWYVSEKNWDAPVYFGTKEEASEYRVEMSAEAMGVDQNVFLSIEKKQNAVDCRRKELSAQAAQKFNAEQEIILEKYSNLISKIEGESYKETEARLSAAMPEKIAGSTFHKLVKKIRK